MGITSKVKGIFLKSMVEKLTDGDTGSTMIGAIAVALLSANIDFSKFFDTAHPDQLAVEAGKAVAAVILGLWAWKTGKKNSSAAA